MKPLAPLATILFLTACRGEAPPVSPTPSPELESMIKQQAESAAPESEQVGALYRGVAYDRGEFEEFRVETEAGQCYTFVAAGDPTIEVFDLRVWGKSKIPAARDKSKGREALVQYCPDETGVARFEGKVAKGAGHFAIGVFKKGAPEKVEVVEKSDKLDLDKLIADEAAAAAPGSKLENMYVAKGKQTDWYAQLKKGSCYWFIGAGQKDVDDFYIYLWDPRNTRIGQTKADSNKAQFGHCPTEDGMFHVQLKVDDDSDEAKVGVFSKPK